jgi:hypothetical protein
MRRRKTLIDPRAPKRKAPAMPRVTIVSMI